MASKSRTFAPPASSPEKEPGGTGEGAQKRDAVHTRFSPRTTRRALLHVSWAHAIRGIACRQTCPSRNSFAPRARRTSLRVPSGILVERRLAARRAEVGRLALVHRAARGALRVDRHPADRIRRHPPPPGSRSPERVESLGPLSSSRGGSSNSS